jgi:NACHT domain
VHDLKEAPRRIAIVVGPGGIGKSIVANLIARAGEAEFKLWVSADRCQDGKLARSLIALLMQGMSEGQPDLSYGFTENSATRRLLDIVQADDRRFLFILDGLDVVPADEDAWSAIALLASLVERNSNTTVLITSRPISLAARLADTKAKYLQMEGLDSSEVAELIRSIVPNFSEETVRRLAMLSDNSGLIVQLLAARLAAVEEHEFNDVAAMLDRYNPQSLWSEVVSHLMEGADLASQIALQAIAVCGGGLNFYELEDKFASEGIEKPKKTFRQLEARGLVAIFNRTVAFSHAAFKDAIEANMEPHDALRLKHKFRRRDTTEYGMGESLYGEW